MSPNSKIKQNEEKSDGELVEAQWREESGGSVEASEHQSGKLLETVNSEDETRPAHAKEDLFSEAAMETDRFGKLYTVINYIFANSDVASWIDWMVEDHSAWFGYVAVATDEGKTVLGRKDILVCWRGTLSLAEWFKNSRFHQVSASEIFGNSHMIHKRTEDFSQSTHRQIQNPPPVLNAIKKLVNKPEYSKEEISITITGHSLGAALATLNATYIVVN
ncbi:phospholipase A1-II 6-like [Mangifera indica]|uniref:phospholipase A1-II 6-like n=1 Tax=Mangifera indica TaxID=29780 RepID=UPI001CFC42EF|nr:phospholipase A1-II 6-like [Mangifera indica]